MAKKEKPKAAEATPRQKKVFNEMVANGGSLKKAMIKAGYSPAYAKNSQKFRRSASWQELLDENLPDWLLVETHAEVLDAKKIDHYVFPIKMTDEEMTELVEQWGFSVVSIVHGDTNNRVYFSAPDNVMKLKAVEVGYKIKNKFEPDVTEHIIRNYEDLSDEELERLYHAKAKSRAKK